MMAGEFRPAFNAAAAIEWEWGKLLDSSDADIHELVIILGIMN